MLAVRLVGAIAAAVLMAIVLLDAFEVVLLPRRVRHGFRLSRQFYRTSWRMGRTLASLLPAGRWRTGFLSAFGPLSLCVLIVLWATGLIAGFALLHWSIGTALSEKGASFNDYLYFSGTTFFTLGYGDMVPTGAVGRTLSVLESGVGFIFLAVIMSYLPVLYQAFSRLEITIALLDARAGSPPSASELLRRLAAGRSPAGPGPFLIEWERWAADLLESHISFPVLSYYRSQHENQSWITELTAIVLDTSANMAAGGRGRSGQLPGRADFRNGAACGCGPVAGLPTEVASANGGSSPRSRLCPLAGIAPRGGRGGARRAVGGRCARGAARLVRAVCPMRWRHTSALFVMPRRSCRQNRRWTTGKPALGRRVHEVLAGCRRGQGTRG